MRFRPTFLAAGLALLAFGAQAQSLPAGQRVATEPDSSVFVYERLGATPSVRLPAWLEGKSTAAESRKKAAAARERVDLMPAAQARVPAATRADATVTR